LIPYHQLSNRAPSSFLSMGASWARFSYPWLWPASFTNPYSACCRGQVFLFWAHKSRLRISLAALTRGGPHPSIHVLLFRSLVHCVRALTCRGTCSSMYLLLCFVAPCGSLHVRETCVGLFAHSKRNIFFHFKVASRCWSPHTQCSLYNKYTYPRRVRQAHHSPDRNYVLTERLFWFHSVRLRNPV
jgi:hypothetical protein